MSAPSPPSVFHWPWKVKNQWCHHIIPGNPTPSSRPRVTQRGTYYPKRVTIYKEHLQAILLENHGLYDTTSKAIGIRAFFFRGDHQRVDIDNLLKMVHDAGEGILWKNDSQVVETFGRIFFDKENPRLEFLVYFVDTDLREWKETRKCERCDKEFKVKHPFWATSKSGRRFCSTDCAYASRRVVQTCAHCGKSFSVARSKLKHHKCKFCSRECTIAYHRTHPLRRVSPSRCQYCGKPVSRKEYTRCKACYLKMRRGEPTGNYWKHRKAIKD